ncbi:unnamed protein product [Brassica oleracea]
MNGCWIYCYWMIAWAHLHIHNYDPIFFIGSGNTAGWCNIIKTLKHRNSTIHQDN